MKKGASYSINVGGRLLELSEPQSMGILNATPDSFYAGSRRQTEAEIAQRAEQIVSEGGSIIDIGACSTRPGAQLVDEAEELNRLHHAVAIIRRTVPEAILSIDTFRANVVKSLFETFGPFIVNDISGGADTEMFSTTAALSLPYILTHSPLGTRSAALPDGHKTEGEESSLSSLLLYFSRRIDELLQLGQKDIIVDPGFGFGKTLEQNYQLLQQLDIMQVFRLPLLVGVSRKSMVCRTLDITPEEALNGTTVLHTLALERGANLLRVHDVRACMEVIKIMKQCSYPSV